MSEKTEDLAERYKSLSQRRDTLMRDKNKIEAELEARKRNLKAKMEEAKKEGFNPDSLADDIKRSEEVLRLKVDNFETELDEAERKMAPMLDEIKG